MNVLARFWVALLPLTVGCQSSLVFVDRFADASVADAGRTDAQVVVRFGGPSVGPEQRVSDDTTIGPFSAPSTWRPTWIPTFQQATQLGAYSAAKRGDVHAIVWVESQYGQYSLRLARVVGRPSDPTLTSSWLIDGNIDAGAQPEILATDTGFTVFWSRPYGPGASRQRAVLRVDDRESSPDLRAIVTYSDQKLGNSIFAAGHEWTIARFGNSGNSPSLRCDEGNPTVNGGIPTYFHNIESVYRMRYDGTRLWVIGSRKIIALNIEADCRQSALAGEWSIEDLRTIATGTSMFADALYLHGQVYLLSFFRDEEFTPRFRIHRTSLRAPREYAPSPNETAVRQWFRALPELDHRASFVVHGNELEVEQCADEGCVEVGLPLARYTIGNENPTPQSPLIPRDFRQPIDANDVLQVEVDASGSNRVWLAYREGAQLRFRVGTVQNESEPFLFHNGGQVGAIQKRGAHWYFHRSASTPSQGFAFAPDDENVLRVGNVGGETWIVTRASGSYQVNVYRGLDTPNARSVVARGSTDSVEFCGETAWLVQPYVASEQPGNSQGMVQLLDLNNNENALTVNREPGSISLTVAAYNGRCTSYIARVGAPFGVQHTSGALDVAFVDLRAMPMLFRDWQSVISGLHVGNTLVLRAHEIEELNDTTLYAISNHGGIVDTLTVPNFRLRGPRTPAEYEGRDPSTIPTVLQLQSVASDGNSLLLVDRVGAQLNAVRIDEHGRELYRGTLFTFEDAPEAERNVPPYGTFAVLGIASSTFAIGYSRYDRASSAYKVFWREVRFIDESRWE